MSKISEDQRRVKVLIGKHQGDSGVALAWRSVGGGFNDGLSVGVVTLTPAQFVKVLKVPTRASELSNKDQSGVEKRKRAINRLPGTADTGYYLTGYVDNGVRVRQGIAVAEKTPASKLMSGNDMRDAAAALGLDDD